MKPRWRNASLAALVLLVMSFALFLRFNGGGPINAMPDTNLALGLSLGTSRNQPVAPLPDIDKLNPLKIELGRLLFFDPILSSGNDVSCSTCHDLDQGGTVRVAQAIGRSDGRAIFNVPTIFNVANNHSLGWRGSAISLPAQNEKILLDENLMAINWDSLVAKLINSSAYRSRFLAAYASPPTKDGILDALTSFEASLRTPDAPFDLYMRGDLGALSALQIKGYGLFKEYGCASCHQGSNIGGNMTQRVGIFSTENLNQIFDDGTKPIAFEDRGQSFRVPSLRNVAITAPYFHDGRVSQLPQAVSLMGKLQLGRDLSQPDIAAIVAFLQSLTGRYNGRNLSNTVDGSQ